MGPLVGSWLKRPGSSTTQLGSRLFWRYLNSETDLVNKNVII
jgi:hypothetical protein